MGSLEGKPSCSMTCAALSSNHTDMQPESLCQTRPIATCGCKALRPRAASFSQHFLFESSRMSRMLPAWRTDACNATVAASSANVQSSASAPRQPQRCVSASVMGQKSSGSGKRRVRMLAHLLLSVACPCAAVAAAAASSAWRSAAGALSSGMAPTASASHCTPCCCVACAARGGGHLA